MQLGQMAYERFTRWMNQEIDVPNIGLSDLSRALPELRQADVILIEGRTRFGQVIKRITLSPWSHAVLYVGRISDQQNPEIRDLLSQHYSGPITEPLVLEAQLGDGTILSPLSKYNNYHIRICHPRRLAFADSEAIILHTTKKLGFEYDVRHVFDLARFLAPYYLAPYGLLPRRWRSSLFYKKDHGEARAICSTLIGEAFHSVEFPITPIFEKEEDGDVQISHSDPRFYTPSDFDTSPYFDVIKYPLIGFDDLAVYRNLPWKQTPSPVTTETETNAQKEKKKVSGIMENWLNKLPSFGR